MCKKFIFLASFFVVLFLVGMVSAQTASEPNPANSAVDVKNTPVLTWMADATAYQYDLYLGTDADLVAAGDASVSRGTLVEASFAVDVNEPLSSGMTYYWKVDVYTGSARSSEFHPGEVWSFRVVDLSTNSWMETAENDSPAYLATFVEDGVYDIGVLSGDITYEFVVLSNPDETEASMCLIGRRGFGDTQAGIKYEQWNNTGTYGATIFGVVDLDFGVPTSPGEYTHLVFVSSETTNTTALYVNGALAGSVDSAIVLSGLVGIGYGAQEGYATPSFDNFDGTVLGVAVYDMALTDEQIVAHSEAYFNPFEEVVPVNPGANGLVAYYAFENDVNDSSDNALHGTIVGDAAFAEGPTGYGMALDLDGDGDYVDCSNSELFSITDAFTLSIWINWRATGAEWQTVIAKGDNAWRLARGSLTQTMDFGFTAGGDRGWQAARTASEVPLGEWHNVIATIDTTNGAKIYLDGVLEGENPDTGGITVGDYPVFIGENSQALNRYWDGLLDEVMIYNRALSEAEILYLAGKRAKPVDPGSDGLLAWWACDEGEGAVVGDVSGNGRDGTIVFGDPVWVEGVSGTAVELVGPTLVEVPPLGMELEGATMGGWIKPYGLQPDWSAIIMHRGTGLAHGFNVLADNQLAYHWNDDSGSWSFRGGDFIPEDDWTFVAVTIDPDKAAFYVNGQAGSVNELAHGPAMWDNNIYLGGDGGDTWVARRMNGALDDVFMYSRVLSAGEIRYLAGARAMDDVLGPDVTALGDVVQGVPNDGDWPGAETPDLAIDDNVETKFLHFKGDFDPDPNTGGAGLQITPAVGPTVVTGLTLTTANDVPGRDPIAFALYGSNESIDGPYELIASGDIVDFAGDVEWPRFTMNATPIIFSNSVAYTHYQLIFTAIRGPVGGSVNSMQIAEIELRTSKY
ncbi:MAG: hypothetical protein JW837_03995 [Sedimentisphaerales bacterium]|nr:hypothetical protein [Sedimentisphaerales bacterium]